MYNFLWQMWLTWLELAPWMLLGMGLSAALYALVPVGFFRSHFRGWRGVIKGVVLGIPMPLCSCGVIPAGIGLKKNGASDGAALGFIISTPQTGVDSILVSGTFLGWPFAFFKMVAALLTGVFGGLAMDAWSSGNTADTSGEFTDCGSAPRGWQEIWLHALDILRSIWFWLLLGVTVSAAISVWLPRAWTAAVNDWGLFASMFLMLIISLPWYVCATASVPVAASLVEAGFPTAAAMVFLMAGPATNVATLGAVAKTFGWRALTIYLSVIIAGSMTGGWLYDAWFGDFALGRGGHSHHHEIVQWWQVVCGLFLLGLVTWLVGKTVFHTWRRQRRSDLGESMSLHVTGMHCQNCVRTLESALRRTGQVDRIKINLDSGQAVIFGSLSRAEVEDIVRQCGYQIAEPS